MRTCWLSSPAIQRYQESEEFPRTPRSATEALPSLEVRGYALRLENALMANSLILEGLRFDLQDVLMCPAFFVGAEGGQGVMTQFAKAF